MQEELEQRTVSVSIQAAKLSGRVLRSAIAAVLRKMEQERTTPKVGRNSMKRLTYKDPGANTIEVSGRIRSFERYARKHQVRYHIEKELGTDPPKWTVYFKANQADALTAAFKEFTRKDLTRSTRPSLLSQLHKFKELAQALGRDRVKNTEGRNDEDRYRCPEKAGDPPSALSSVPSGLCEAGRGGSPCPRSGCLTEIIRAFRRFLTGFSEYVARCGAGLAGGIMRCGDCAAGSLS